MLDELGRARWLRRAAIGGLLCWHLGVACEEECGEGACGIGFDGKIYEKALDQVGLTLNANSLPTDQGGAFRPSGVRLGTPAITTRGLKEDKMAWIVELIDRVLANPESEENIAQVRAEVNAEMVKYPLFAW